MGFYIQSIIQINNRMYAPGPPMFNQRSKELREYTGRRDSPKRTVNMENFVSPSGMTQLRVGLAFWKNIEMMTTAFKITLSKVTTLFKISLLSSPQIETSV